MIRAYCLQVTLLLFGGCVMANADENIEANYSIVENKVISLGNALNLALMNSPAIHTAESRLKIANQGLVKAKSTFMPQLNLSSTTQKLETFSKLPNLFGSIVDDHTSHNSSSNISVNLNVYNGGVDLRGLQLAKAKVQEAEFLIQKARLEVAQALLEHIHKTHLALSELNVVILQLKLSEERTSQARRSFSLGRMSKFSLAEILYEFETKEFEKRKKEQEYEYVLENFISMIGVDFLTEPEMQAHDTLFRYIDGIVLHGLDKGAATSSVRLWQSRVQQAQLSARIAQGGYHPRVDIFTQANYASIGETGYRSAFEDQHKSNTSVGISLTWNLFDGFNTTATVREAFENINIAQFNLDLAAKKKRKSVASSLLAQKQVETEHSHASKYLQLLQMKYEISNEKVKLGRMNTIDLKAIEVGMSIQKIKLDQLSEKAAYYEAKLLLDGQL